MNQLVTDLSTCTHITTEKPRAAGDGNRLERWRVARTHLVHSALSESSSDLVITRTMDACRFYNFATHDHGVFREPSAAVR
jgi:hypothetical protein